jgi:hypothetical protein
VRPENRRTKDPSDLPSVISWSGNAHSLSAMTAPTVSLDLLFASLHISSLFLGSPNRCRPTDAPRLHRLQSSKVGDRSLVQPFPSGLMAMTRNQGCVEASQAADSRVAFAGAVDENRTLQIYLDASDLSGELLVELKDMSDYSVATESYSYTWEAPPADLSASQGIRGRTLVVDIAGRSDGMLSTLSALTPSGAKSLIMHRSPDDSLILVVEKTNREKTHVWVGGAKLKQCHAGRQVAEKDQESPGPARSAIVSTESATATLRRRRNLRRQLHVQQEER